MKEHSSRCLFDPIVSNRHMMSVIYFELFSLVVKRVLRLFKLFLASLNGKYDSSTIQTIIQRPNTTPYFDWETM